MKFKHNPDSPSTEILIKEMDALIKGAEEKYPAMVAAGKLSEITANFKWNALQHIRARIAGDNEVVAAAPAPAPKVVQVDMFNEPDQPKLHTALDQYERAVEMNPAIEGLRDKLDLDLDY